MRGWIKWLSQDGTRGRITNDANEDFSFTIADVIGRSIPKVGQQVEFEPPHPRVRQAHDVRLSPRVWRDYTRWLVIPFAALIAVAKAVIRAILNSRLP